MLPKVTLPLPSHPCIYNQEWLNDPKSFVNPTNSATNLLLTLSIEKSERQSLMMINVLPHTKTLPLHLTLIENRLRFRIKGSFIRFVVV